MPTTRVTEDGEKERLLWDDPCFISDEIHEYRTTNEMNRALIHINLDKDDPITTEQTGEYAAVNEAFSNIQTGEAGT